ncbi:FAD-dependent oxidoreductase [Tundrisphaera sp. TA3]|uniref:FAD-dependent oxidoreductase n=1 Tax=Tundrisphaera sp. TA3 TaxID=3435775 RepID=UPI003EB82798
MTFRRWSYAPALFGILHLFALTARSVEPPPRETHGDFDVVIAGGTTAAFAAALASADSGARTALIEPTDWVGGQITASAVPAIDEAWHKITDPKMKKVLNVATIARDRANMTPDFRAMLDATGNPGRGWVSQYCFEPKKFLDAQLLPREKARGDKLVVFREAVIKSVEADAASGRITAIHAIRRIPRPGVAWGGYDRLLSLDLDDWYSPEPSDRFDKVLLTFRADDRPGHRTVFLEATEWGEVLALSGAPYLQGVEAVDGGREGDDTCGQATVFDFIQRLNPTPVDEPPGPKGVEKLGFALKPEQKDPWAHIWTYRRLKGKEAGPAVGDLSLQNWGYSDRMKEGGNDYPFGYLFPPRSAAAAEAKDWKGGLNRAVLAGAEQRALGWHYWLKEHVPAPFVPGQVTLDRGLLGTGHGLAKLPYIRDTRRSIGLDGFILKISDLEGPVANLTGKRFKDRIALGAYPADIHPVTGCDFPSYVHAHNDTLPFCIPFRALTNERYGNMMVAGKTMAQSFMANSATRLHPIEWSTGTASGVIAAFMARENLDSRAAFGRIGEIQALVRAKTPIDWTIDGKVYPTPDEATEL